PSPRTMTMTIYGDLDVSTIDEMPRNRGKIVTAVRDDSKLGEVLTFLQTQLEAGRQLYVIYPLIDESEKLDVKAAAAEYELWRERFHPFRCELLHGRIAPAEKQQIMERFRRGETNALISTTVLEVGVDVPNANVMLIENAERFGLAQMHQLRGRIGRGEHKSYCIFLTSARAKEASAKLAVLERTSNGFEVAEAEWDLRGPGDLRGRAGRGVRAAKTGPLNAGLHLIYDYHIKHGGLNLPSIRKSEKYTLASQPSVDSKQVASLEALNRERRSLVSSVLPSVVAVKTSKKIGIRREYGLDPFEFFFGNRQRRFRSPRDEALVLSSLGSGVIVIY